MSDWVFIPRAYGDRRTFMQTSFFRDKLQTNSYANKKCMQSIHSLTQINVLANT